MNIHLYKQCRTVSVRMNERAILVIHMYYTNYRGQKFEMKADIHSFCQMGITKSMLKANRQTRMVNTDKITCFKDCGCL